MAVQTFTSAGTAPPWLCPAGVFFATVECWGAGGGSGGASSTGTAGAGGPGGASVFTGPSGTVTANGGLGGGAGPTGILGAGGAPGTGSTNTTHHDGGAGASAVAPSGIAEGGGGGGSAGTGSAGNAGSGFIGGTAVAGGGPGALGNASGAGNTPASGPGGGGGGGGQNAGGFGGGGGGGGGGEYASQVIPVTPGTLYSITVGAPGSPGTSSSGAPGAAGWAGQVRLTFTGATQPATPSFPAGYGPTPQDFTSWVQVPFQALTSKVVFRAERATALTLTNGSLVLIPFDSVLEDPLSGWSATTHTWTCPALYSGTYEISVTVSAAAAPDTTTLLTAAVILNGATSEQVSRVWASSTQANFVSGLATLQLYGGQDNVGAQGFWGSSANGAVVTTAGQRSTMEIVWTGL